MSNVAFSDLGSNSEVISTDIDSNKSVEYGRTWPGGDAHILCHLVGTATLCIELTAPDLGAWVRCGDLITQSGAYSVHVPPGVLMRLTIAGHSGASGHCDVFEG